MEKIPIKHIIEVGFCRKKDICCNCSKKMDIKYNYSIQLCTKCREKVLEENFKEIEEEFKKPHVKRAFSQLNREFDKLDLKDFKTRADIFN